MLGGLEEASEAVNQYFSNLVCLLCVCVCVVCLCGAGDEFCAGGRGLKREGREVRRRDAAPSVCLSIMSGAPGADGAS